MNINFLRQKLETPKNEEERLWAYGQLKQILEDAQNLYDKYSKRLEDWTSRTVSGK